VSSVLPDRIKKLPRLTLSRGSHHSFKEGYCATELVSWLADEEFSDHPACLSPVLGAFLRSWNDSLDEEGRQKLKPFLPRVIGTRDDDYDEQRAWLATDWLVRVCAPAWLELAGIKGSPAALRALAPLTNAASARAAQPTIDQAREKGKAAWAAVAGEARTAGAGEARDAAWTAAREAAGEAARDAARDAGEAAWVATREAGEAAWVAGEAAWVARDAGEAARVAWVAAGAATRVAWVAARIAAWDAVGVGEAAGGGLEPTKIELQASALELLENMVSLGEQERAA
jgi:hypothetical protein